MKKFKQSVLGVTLLEVMLVLAIAAMIIVMSVRYYQAATSSQQATAALSLVQGITAAGDTLAQGGNGYTEVTLPNVQNVMNGGKTLNSPWGSPVNIDSQSTTTYKVTIAGVPSAVCTNLVVQLTANTRYTLIQPTTCDPTAPSDVSYTYNSTK